jgi:hypothetical protein
MNEMDLLARFRDEVPPAISPQAEALFTTGMNSERPVIPASRPSRVQRSRRKAMMFTPIAAGLAAAAVAIAMLTGGSAPARPAVLTVKLLADRAAAAALIGPQVSAGQWVYLKEIWESPTGHDHAEQEITQVQWQTADGSKTYVGGNLITLTPSTAQLKYSQLSTLPASPAALDRYFERLEYPGTKATQANKDVAAFSAIEGILVRYVTPPGLTAELYRALADIPTVRVNPRVRDIAGRTGVAFVLPATAQSMILEIILNPTSYSFMAQAGWQGSQFTEEAILQKALVTGPGVRP